MGSSRTAAIGTSEALRSPASIAYIPDCKESRNGTGYWSVTCNRLPKRPTLLCTETYSILWRLPSDINGDGTRIGAPSHTVGSQRERISSSIFQRIASLRVNTTKISRKHLWKTKRNAGFIGTSGPPPAHVLHVSWEGWTG